MSLVLQVLGRHIIRVGYGSSGSSGSGGGSSGSGGRSGSSGSGSDSSGKRHVQLEPGLLMKYDKCRDVCLELQVPVDI